MTPADLYRLGSKLRTQVRGDLFEYIDRTLPLIMAADTRQTDIAPQVDTDGCLKCAERRQRKAAAMKRYRSKAEAQLNGR